MQHRVVKQNIEECKVKPIESDEIASLLLRALPNDPYLRLLGSKNIAKHLLPYIDETGTIVRNINQYGQLDAVMLLGRISRCRFLFILFKSMRIDLPFKANQISLNFVDILKTVMYFLLSKRRSLLEVLWICVDQNARGMGLGSELINTAKSIAEQSGHGLLRVKTLESTPQNIWFYEQNGFKVESRFLGRCSLIYVRNGIKNV